MPSSRPTRSKQRSKELPDNSKSKFTLQSFVRAFPSAPELTYFQPGLLGSGLYAPFGRATYSEAGTITFAMLPFWRVCTVVRIEYFYRFVQRGSRHIHGDTLSRVAKPIIPSSGNPSPDYFATFTSSGTGQITAPGLT